MASIKPSNGKWRAAVFKKGVRATKVFPTKSAATAWATHIEFEIDQGKGRPIPDKTFGDLLEHYGKTESPKKKGYKWELKRIKALESDPLYSVKLVDLDSPHIAAWRDRRLACVQPGTVLREWNLLSPACNVAVKEWKWLKHNPMSDVKRPGEVPPRNRTYTPEEIELLRHVMGEDVKTVSGRTFLAFLFALETGMREGEIAEINPPNTNLKTRVHKVAGGKTRSAKRDVPLSTNAIVLLTKVNCNFQLTAEQISSNFAKYRKQAGILDTTFHDTRHNAITALSKKLSVLELARAVGHKKIQELMTYYNPSAEDLAKKLD